MKTIKDKGATVSVPGLIDLPKAEDGLSGIVMEAMQAMLLKIALYQCRSDYETRRQRQQQGIALAKTKGACKGRKPDNTANAKIIELRNFGYTIAKAASTLNVSVSVSQVKLILKQASAASVSAT